jgi:hypothetical protein
MTPIPDVGIESLSDQVQSLFGRTTEEQIRSFNYSLPNITACRRRPGGYDPRPRTTTVPTVVLPRRVVSAHVILPSLKQLGHAIANVQGVQADLTATLDLRVRPPGTYFLATTHEGDPAQYFYPLTVR